MVKEQEPIGREEIELEEFDINDDDEAEAIARSNSTDIFHEGDLPEGWV